MMSRSNPHLSEKKTDQLPEREELLQYVLENKGLQRWKDKSIPPRGNSDPRCLSFAQERFWFLEQFQPNHSVYNSCKAERLVGRLNLTALEESLSAIVCRHEVLRTLLAAIDGRPIPQIVPNLTLALPLLDLRGMPEAEREAEALRIVTEESKIPFDLSRDPVIRAKVLRLKEEEHVLLLVLHQIVFDSWSVGIFFSELWTFYIAYVAGKQPTLKELPIQYPDFAAWQRQLLQGEVLASHLSYWKEQLGNTLPVLDLPADRRRPPLQTHHGARRYIVLPKFLTEALKALSRWEGATLFMTLLAAFMTLLYRYTDQKKIVVGCPISNRNLPEIENLIGSFVNTLVLCTDLSGNPTFREVLSRVRDVCLSAYAHQDLPFEKLVEELQPRRDLGRSPLFQTMFAFQNAPSPRLSLSDLKSESLEVDAGISKFDLTLSLVDREQQLIGYVEYSTDLFNHSTIERLMGHFETLLEGIIANPDQPISSLPLLTEAERDQLLVGWNNTGSDYPNDSCIHGLFEAQVERTPDTVAVQFKGKQLTFRELNNRANQLAHYLQRLGIGPENLVGICVEPSLEMVVGLLGILKAGGAYMPLDPLYPRERLTFMLEDAQVSVLLTQGSLIEDGRLKPVLSEAEGIEDSEVPPFSILDPQIKMICLDRDREKIAQQSERNPDKGPTPQNLVYVIYTSGSTGQPKGVQISHRSVINCLHSIRAQIGLTEKDVLLAVTTISFDIAALENYLPLISGAKLVLASRDEVLDAKLLLDRLTECGAAVMQATPSAWGLLLDAGWRSSRNFKILCGGETLSRQLADQLLEGGASLWNLYGPTETTIWSTIAKVEPGESPVLIGRPIANTQIYILDSHLQPVPAGVHGELYIGGDGVARGYLNRPELNAERFVLNPFSNHLGSRLYRTGDLARYRPNGDIEFISRVDNQVKIHGYRIELGEIEVTLDRHPAIRKSLVVAREDFPEEQNGMGNLSGGADNPKFKIQNLKSIKRLVAYVVPRHQPIPSVNELRGFLGGRLPEYMIPSVFMELETIPLTSNGKVDYRGLPEPGRLRPATEEIFVPPRTPVEQLLAGIWAEVLRLERVSVHDNFFRLGGHSLIAARVISRICKAFQIDLPLRRIFETPTVDGLARSVEEGLKSGQKIQTPAILPRLNKEPVAPSIAQEPLLLLERLFPGISLFNMPAAYRLKGPLDLAALEWSINRVVERHEALRTTFPLVNGQPAQFVATALSMKLEMTDLYELTENECEAEMRKLVRQAAEQLFDLANGPLFRVKLLRRGEQDHVFLLTTHHVISDGGSMVVFFRDLAAFYEAYSNGFTPSLPRLPIQYADFAHWQRQALTGELMEAQLAYWKQQLDGPLPPLEFCTGRGRVKELSFLTARKSLSITGELFESLKKLSQREESTLFLILLTVLKVLLYCCTGETDVRVGTLVENRNRRETENLIGHFANTLIIRTNLSADSSFHQLVRQVRDIALAAYTHQDLPFEAVAQALETEKKIDRASLCQVMFIYQTSPLHPINLPGLNVSALDGIKRVEEPELTITTFDLILLLKEGPSGLVGSLIYKADVFDEAIIDRILGDFHAILQRIIFEVDLPVRELCSLGADRAEAPSR
jgi:amino acid adenylation domain-containing protein